VKTASGRPQSSFRAGTDGQMLAQIADVCCWYAVGGPPTAERQAAALTELAYITRARTDLLARYAVTAWRGTTLGLTTPGTSAPLSCASPREPIWISLSAGAPKGRSRGVARTGCPHQR
jgi:hypothetical protein